MKHYICKMTTICAGMQSQHSRCTLFARWKQQWRTLAESSGSPWLRP